MEAPDRVLFVFLDGIGLGEGDARINPLVRARLPVLRSLLGGRDLIADTAALPTPSAAASLAAADVTLGIPGLPQSGTGQTSLLTGVNAAAILGRHFGPWVPTTLREMLADRNILRRASVQGCTVAFANAYPARYLGSAGAPRRRPAAPPLAASSAGLPWRDADSLREGRAVASSITNDGWRRHLDRDAPDITPQEAGGNLARIAAAAHLTLFAHYDTDTAGHRGGMPAAVAALERVDAFLDGLLAGLRKGTLLLIASDHGNIEDVSGGHTLNPVPVMAVGPGSTRVAESVRSVTDVAPLVLDLLHVLDE